MLKILGFSLILLSTHNFGGTTPLIGKDVRIADEQEFPFVVSIATKSSKNAVKKELNHFCGGSLITKLHVLTAAHCFNHRKKENLVVLVGSTDLRQAEEYDMKWWITYNEWIEHDIDDEESFVPDAHDIAIAKMRVPLSKCGKLDFQLPYLTQTPDEDLYGRKAMTAGWGSVGTDSPSRFMRTAVIDVLRPENCTLNTYKHVRSSLRELLSTIYFCTKAKPPVRIGCGDSGGPLIINKREIIGINIAFCVPHANAHFATSQSIHASVNYYQEFIKDMKKR